MRSFEKDVVNVCGEKQILKPEKQEIQIRTVFW